MATMLLMSVCSFAQNSNTPLKGDVNGDGKVDVADIVAILKIMKDAGVTQYTVTYHSNGGNSTPAPQRVNAGETVTLAGAISRNADSSYIYEFSHWNTNSSGTGTSYDAGQTIPVNDNIDLYAQWNKTAITPVTPTTEYYWYVGQTQPTVDNYTSLANQVNGYTSPIEYTNTSGVRGRSYILIHNSKSIASIIGKVSGGNISFSEDTSINIPNYKVYKTAAIATDSTIIITIQ